LCDGFLPFSQRRMDSARLVAGNSTQVGQVPKFL
jgi:hypothetical protein